MIERDGANGSVRSLALGVWDRDGGSDLPTLAAGEEVAVTGFTTVGCG